jgi:hypothetical protein
MLPDKMPHLGPGGNSLSGRTVFAVWLKMPGEPLFLSDLADLGDLGAEKGEQACLGWSFGMAKDACLFSALFPPPFSAPFFRPVHTLFGRASV